MGETSNEPEAKQVAQRVDLADVLAALEATSDDLTAHTDRIAALEACNDGLEQENDRLRGELARMIEKFEIAKKDSSAATENADQAAAKAANHTRHASTKQDSLTAVLNELAQIAAAAAKLRLRMSAAGASCVEAGHD